MARKKVRVPFYKRPAVKHVAGYLLGFMLVIAIASYAVDVYKDHADWYYETINGEVKTLDTFTWVDIDEKDKNLYI